MSSEMEAEGGGSSDAMPLDVSEEQPAAQPVNAVATHHKATADSDLPWVEKYRPSTLDELIAHDEIISIITRLIEAGKLPHLLFYGPPGTGKTSTILAAARSMYGTKTSGMTLELNASDDRGIGVVRDQIKSFAGTKQLFSKGVKLIILDEADAMTHDAQFALRRVIEKNTKNARFCMICNYVSRIIPALQSRCTRFRFAPLQPAQVRDRMRAIIAAEGVDVSEDGEEALLELSQGDMRRVLNVLQAAHMAHSPAKIGAAEVYSTTGNPQPADMCEMLRLMLNVSYTDAFSTIRDMCSTHGYALNDVLRHLATLVLGMQLPPAVLALLLDELSTIEWRLASGSNDKHQLAALVGAFMIAREMMTPPDSTESPAASSASSSSSSAMDEQ